MLRTQPYKANTSKNASTNRTKAKIVKKDDKIIDPNDPSLTWSDDESDWKTKPPPEPKAPELDEFQTAQSKVIEEHKKWDYKRSKFHGDIKLKKIQGLLEREKVMPYLYNFEIPFPHVPAHVMEYLGHDTVKCLWREFIDHGTDETEMLQVRFLVGISKNMKDKYGISLPFGDLKFTYVESQDDYVEFKDVVGQLYKPFVAKDPRGQKSMVLDRALLPPCCALPNCRYNFSGVTGHYEEPYRGLPNQFCLNTVYERMKLVRHGNLRVKHITDIMDTAFIPYDKKRLPKLFWDIRSNFLITKTEELENLVEAIRTDMDIERKKDPNDIYPIPNWLAAEFTTSEIMMYKSNFKQIDVDRGGSVDVYELQKLTENLGNKISLEQAQLLLDEYDIDRSGTIDFAEFMMLVYKVQRGAIEMENNLLAQSMVEMKSQLKIFEEIDVLSITSLPCITLYILTHPLAQDFNDNPVEYCSVYYYGGTPVVCEFYIDPPDGSPYEGGRFRFKVKFLDGYPYRCPEATFPHKVFMVNVYQQFDGTVNLPHLKYIWDSNWTLNKLLKHVVAVMLQPDLTLLPPKIVYIAKAWYWWKEEESRQAEALAKVEADLKLAKQLEEKKKAEESKAKMLAFLQAAKGNDGGDSPAMEATGITNDTPSVAPGKSDSDGTQAEVKEDKQAKVVDEHEAKREEFSNLTDYGPLLDELNRIEQMHVNTVALWMWNKERFKNTAQFFIAKYNTAKRERGETKSGGESDAENDTAIGEDTEDFPKGNNEDQDEAVAEEEMPLSKYDDLPITKEVKDYFGITVDSKEAKDDEAVANEFEDDPLVINTEFDMSHLEELDYEEHMRYLVSDKKVVDHLSRYPFHSMPKPSTKRTVERSKKQSTLTTDLKFFEECNPWPINRDDD